MIYAIDINETRDYVCKADEKSEKPTVWKVGVIDSITMSKLDKVDVEYNMDTEDTKIKANLMGRELEFVRHGLKGWQNFCDRSGQEIKPEFITVGRAGGSSQILSDKVLQKIPADVIRELAAEIRKGNVLSENERKN